MQKLLFIDRDGCLIEEPLEDQQVDSLEKLRFRPGVFAALAQLAKEGEYQFVMVTNQDGLGTNSFPEPTFWPAHQRMLDTLEGEGIVFSAIHIDRSFAHEGKPTRKPGTAMLTEYMTGAYDLVNSYVIGDRLTDVQLAKNLGAKAILLRNTDDPTGREADITLIADHWSQIQAYLSQPPRRVQHQRNTKETQISIDLCLDGTGKGHMETGLGFFDHMLDQLARHGGLDLTIVTKGDLHIDEHHTIEDTALALGEAFAKALSDKRGLERYGFCLPMDDVLAQVAIDFGGRPWIVWEADFQREKVGDMPTEMFFHFFKSFSDAARCNLNVQVSGQNEHHKIEAIFKAFAKAIRMAVRRDPVRRELPSTKGVL